MIVVISDASSLILLEKIKLLKYMIENTKLVIPNAVYDEAIKKGIEKKYIDAIELDKKTKEGKIKVILIKDKKKFDEIKTNFNLARGETEAIVLYYEKKGHILAVDDLKAMKYCDYYNIPFTTTINLVLDYFNKRTINKQEAIEMIKNLGIYGRYKNEIIFYAIKQIGA